MDSSPPPPLPADYPRFLAALKERIRAARFRAALAVNRELILLYWDLGRRIVEKQKRERWGTAILERISRDLRAAFPGTKGYSRQNLQRMSAFHRAWSEGDATLQQPVGEFWISSGNEADSIICPQAVGKLKEPIPQSMATPCSVKT